MADCRITCIIKPNRFSRHEHITHVGNSITPWMITRENAIANIDAKLDTFYVLDAVSEKRSEVGVVRETGKLPYLRTHADGYYNDNLLALDTCPIN